MATDPLSHVASWITPASADVAANSELSQDRPATAEEAAAIEFEPVGGPGTFDCFANPAWNEECRDLGVTLRLAGALAQKTKAELTDGIKRLIADNHDIDAFQELFVEVSTAAKRLEDFAKLLRAVNMRLFVVASALELDFEREGDAA